MKILCTFPSNFPLASTRENFPTVIGLSPLLGTHLDLPDADLRSYIPWTVCQTRSWQWYPCWVDTRHITHSSPSGPLTTVCTHKIYMLNTVMDSTHKILSHSQVHNFQLTVTNINYSGRATHPNCTCCSGRLRMDYVNYFNKLSFRYDIAKARASVFTERYKNLACHITALPQLCMDNILNYCKQRKIAFHDLPLHDITLRPALASAHVILQTDSCHAMHCTVAHCWLAGWPQIYASSLCTSSMKPHAMYFVN